MLECDSNRRVLNDSKCFREPVCASDLRMAEGSRGDAARGAATAYAATPQRVDLFSALVHVVLTDKAAVSAPASPTQSRLTLVSWICLASQSAGCALARSLVNVSRAVIIVRTSARLGRSAL